MHADGKSTLASVSKWNLGKVNYPTHKERKQFGTELALLYRSVLPDDGLQSGSVLVELNDI